MGKVGNGSRREAKTAVCEVLLLRVDEAAKRLGLGRSLTYRFIQTGELASVKIAGARRVLVSDLLEFVRQLKEQEEAG